MASSSDHFSLRAIALPAFGPSLLFGFGEGAIFPILALSARELGASSALAGLIVALVGLGSLLANLPAAALATRYGERRAMVGAALFSLLGLVLCLLARDPWLLGAGVLMVGLASAVFLLARQTYLIEAVPLRMRARAMSTLGGTMRIGMFTGPFVSAGVIHLTDLSGAYWVSAVAMLGAGLVSLSVPDLGPKAGTSASDAKKSSADINRPAAATTSMLTMAKKHIHVLLTLGIGTALVAALRACRQIVIPLWADHIGLDAATTATIYGLMGAVDMLLFYPAGRIMDLYGRLWVALPCMLIMGLSMMAIPLTNDWVSLLLVCLILGFGNGIGSGIVMTIGADASPAAGRTVFLGIWRQITDIGSSGGPLLISGLTAVASLATGITAVGSLGFLAAWIFWRWLPRGRPSA